MANKKSAAFWRGAAEAVGAHLAALAAFALTERFWHLAGHVVAVIIVEALRALSLGVEP
jgi:hypothetical protein